MRVQDTVLQPDALFAAAKRETVEYRVAVFESFYHDNS